MSLVEEPTPDGGESPWASSVVLGSGDIAFIRPLTTADKDALAAFHARQSAESVYRRYFSPKPTLSSKELEHFTNVDMVDRAALAVELQDEFIAWASYERWPGRNEAEAAFMVDDEHHGKGIATLLLEHLAAIARTNGIERFTAEVLGDNRAMLAVFAKSGWPLQRRFDSGVVDLDWELATTEEFLDSVERREQRADSRAVARILFPRAIAVIGASDRPDSVGTPLWRNALAGDVPAYPVNPAHSELDGQHCYRSVAELPDEVSLAIIAVPASAIDATIDACIEKRMRGAIVVTDIDGSADAGDVDIGAIISRARRNGLRLIGPSSMGAASANPDSLLQAALVDVELPPGGVAISMQSGSLGGSLLRRAQALQLGLSWFVSLGDKGDISGNDLLQFWEDDDNTRVIAMYTESLGNARKFARIARRVSRRRPIVAVRTGAAADGNLGSAIYQQAGLIEVPTVYALLDTARVLASQPVPQGPNVAVITNSRSPGTLASAALETAGLVVVDGIRLPVDARPEEYSDAVGAALDREDVDAALVIHAPALPSGLDSPIAEQIVDAARDSSKPVVAVMLGSRDGPILPGSPVPAFAFPEQAAAVLGRCWSYGRWLATELETTAATTTSIDPRAARSVITELLGANAGAPVVLDAVEQRRLLRTYGIGMALAAHATPADAVDVARHIGYPVAIKAAGRTIGRSVRAGVALDLSGDDDVVESVAQMQDSLGDGAASLTIQRMVPPGFDIQIRCVHDDRLGVIVLVGLGGEQADVIDDRTSRLAPVLPSTAAAMLTETKVAGALQDAGIDPAGLIETICLAAQLAADHPEIAELDLNPVIVSSSRTVVTDALIRIESHQHDDTPLRKLD